MTPLHSPRQVSVPSHLSGRPVREDALIVRRCMYKIAHQGAQSALARARELVAPASAQGSTMTFFAPNQCHDLHGFVTGGPPYLFDLDHASQIWPGRARKSGRLPPMCRVAREQFCTDNRRSTG